MNLAGHTKLLFSRVRTTNRVQSRVNRLINHLIRLKFKDRFSAGEMLGGLLWSETELIRELHNHRGRLIVIGIPRGGILTANAVAKKLSATMNVMVPRRLVSPYDDEATIGAVTEDGEIFLNQVIIDFLKISQKHIEQEKEKKLEEIGMIKSRYGIDTIDLGRQICGRTVILVDDGAASGSTLVSSLRYIRRQRPNYLIVGIPVAPKATINFLQKEADRVVCIMNPHDDFFRCVEEYYVDFRQITDNVVADLLKE
jgi:putative phosphoribosyl transferase